MSERSDFFGGGQRSLRDLALSIRSVGVEPLAILPGPGPLAAAIEGGGVACESLLLPPIRRSAGLPACAALSRLVRLVRTHSIDLLHSESPRTALYAGLAALISGRRHVWHLRSSRPSSDLADRLLISLCDAVVAVSAAAATRSAATRASRKVRVIPTGLPAIPFLDRLQSRARLGLPQDRIILGVVGRLEPDKGAEDAIATLAMVRAFVPGALLVFVGPDGLGGSWTERCRQRAGDAGLAEAVLFLGAVPEAASLLRGFDIILHPSRHEALPRVLIEALFAGVPAVAYSIGGIREVIETGETGLLVPDADPAALASAAAGLARDEALRRRLSDAGMRRAPVLFGIDAMVRRIRVVYDDLLPAGGRPVVPARESAR